MFKTPVLFEKKKVKNLLPPKKEYAFRKFRPVDVRTGKVESRILSKKAGKFIRNGFKIKNCK